jgi:hypothetical protein
LDKIISKVQVLHPSEVAHRVENPLLSLGLLLSVLLRKIRLFCIQLGLNGFVSEMLLKVETIVSCPQAAKSQSQQPLMFIYMHVSLGGRSLVEILLSVPETGRVDDALSLVTSSYTSTNE